MRQYGSVPPWKGPENTDALSPTIESATGVGTGGGATLIRPGVAQSNPAFPNAGTNGFGDILVTAGAGVSANGNIAILFSATPAVMFVSGDEEFGTVTEHNSGNALIIAWSGGTMKPRSKPYKLHYEIASNGVATPTFDIMLEPSSGVFELESGSGLFELEAGP